MTCTTSDKGQFPSLQQPQRQPSSIDLPRPLWPQRKKKGRSAYTPHLLSARTPSLPLSPSLLSPACLFLPPSTHPAAPSSPPTKTRQPAEPGAAATLLPSPLLLRRQLTTRQLKDKEDSSPQSRLGRRPQPAGGQPTTNHLRLLHHPSFFHHQRVQTSSASTSSSADADGQPHALQSPDSTRPRPEQHTVISSFSCRRPLLPEPAAGRPW